MEDNNTIQEPIHESESDSLLYEGQYDVLGDSLMGSPLMGESPDYKKLDKFDFSNIEGSTIKNIVAENKLVHEITIDGRVIWTWPDNIGYMYSEGIYSGFWEVGFSQGEPLFLNHSEYFKFDKSIDASEISIVTIKQIDLSSYADIFVDDYILGINNINEKCYIRIHFISDVDFKLSIIISKENNFNNKEYILKKDINIESNTYTLENIFLI